MLPTFKMKDFSEHVVAAERRRLDLSLCAHWHDCCEVELLLSGRGTHIINGEARPLTPGDFYMLTPFDSHELVLDEPIVVLGIMFDENLVSSELFEAAICRELSRGSLHTVLPADGHDLERVKRYFEAVISETERASDDGYGELCISRLVELILIELLRSLEGREPSAGAPKRAVREAILYMYRHYTEPLTLTALARELHFNESYLSRLFHSSVGKPFKRCLTELRLRHACRLLVNTTHSVTDICYDCGFDSYSNFMRSFKTAYKMSPLQFRAEHLRS